MPRLPRVNFLSTLEAARLGFMCKQNTTTELEPKMARQTWPNSSGGIAFLGLSYYSFSLFLNRFSWAFLFVDGPFSKPVLKQFIQKQASLS